MTAPQWQRIFRKSDTFQVMTKLLDEADVAWTVESGGKHPKLVFEFGGRQHKHVVSTSPSDPYAYRLAERDIKRILRSADTGGDTQEESIMTEPTGSALPMVFEGRSVRILDRSGDPWFVAGDASKILGYASAKDLTRTLDEDEKGRHTVPTPGGDQEVAIISEAGLYRAIVQRRAVSSVPAETRDAILRFQRWVFHDVLPSIRRHGAYASDPILMQKLEEMAAELAEVRAAADLALEAAGRVEADGGKFAPTIDLASTVTSDDLIALAGIKPGQRVRGTSAMVTGRVLTFTAGHGCFKTPAHLNPSMPWRFPREKATEWLFGSQLGAEQIRNQIARQAHKKAQRARPAQQGHLTLVGAP